MKEKRLQFIKEEIKEELDKTLMDKMNETEITAEVLRVQEKLSVAHNLIQVLKTQIQEEESEEEKLSVYEMIEELHRQIREDIEYLGVIEKK